MFQRGDQVIRKNYKGKIGIIERINGTKAYVRWEDALRPFKGGYGDNHSSISLKAILLATEENLAKMKAAKERRSQRERQARTERCKDWRYCKISHRRVNKEGWCYDCQKAHSEDETFPWMPDAESVLYF